MPDSIDEFVNRFKAPGKAPPGEIEASGAQPNSSIDEFVKKFKTPGTSSASVPLAPQQPPGAHRTINLMGSALLSGLDLAAGIPGDVEALGHAALGGSQFLPTSSGITGFTDSLGLTNRPDLEPQNAWERYGAAAAKGIGASVPAVSLGPWSMIARAGALGGIGGEAMHQFAPNLPFGQEAAGLVAGGLSSAPRAIAHELTAGHGIQALVSGVGVNELLHHVMPSVALASNKLAAAAAFLAPTASRAVRAALTSPGASAPWIAGGLGGSTPESDYLPALTIRKKATEGLPPALLGP